MKALKYLIPLSIISLIYNAAILFSVTLNLDWVRTRAAGGQYETFPIGIRFVDFLMGIFMLFLIAMLWNHREKPMDEKGPMVTRIIGYTFFISMFFQIASRSMDERWNAIPAGILAVTFIALSRRESNR
ncbi:MAG: hypothetical protein FGM48_02300 [Candidatus Nanopelagicaceae bacterium]|jgi:hypothetical protein|nr:hypothetical protein [Candidatus Nanopelagicaceae bacterium]